MRGREVPPRRPSVPCDRHHSTSTFVVCEHPAALRSIRCWVVPGRDSSSSAGSVRRVPSLHSAVSLRLVYTWPLFLHASTGVNPAGSVPGSQEAGVPPAGAARTHRHQAVIKKRRFSRRYTLRRWDSAGLRLQRSTAVRASEPSRLRAGMPSVLPHRRSLPLLQGALRLPSAALQSPPSPHCQTRSRLAQTPPHRSCRLRDWTVP